MQKPVQQENQVKQHKNVNKMQTNMLKCNQKIMKNAKHEQIHKRQRKTTKATATRQPKNNNRLNNQKATTAVLQHIALSSKVPTKEQF